MTASRGHASAGAILAHGRDRARFAGEEGRAIEIGHEAQTSGYRSVSLLGRLYLLVALAVLPAIAIQVYNELAMRHEREAQVGAEALRLAEFAASELDGLLTGARPLLISLAGMPSIRDGDAAGCGRLLTELTHDLTDYTGLGAIDLAGRSRCAQPEPLFGGEWRDWRRSGTRRPSMSAASRRARAPGQGFLPVTLPFKDREGRVAGVVGLSIDLGRLNRQFAARVLPEGASFGVTDRDGTLLVRVPDAALVGTPMRPQYRWLLESKRPDTLDSTGRDGLDRIVGYVPPAAIVDGALLIRSACRHRPRPRGSRLPPAAASC